MPAVWEARQMNQNNTTHGGAIIVAGTPLGNSDDASPRLRHALLVGHSVFRRKQVCHHLWGTSNR